MMEETRRNFLKKSALLGLTGLASSLLSEEKMNHISTVANQLSGDNLYILPKLLYNYDALEPYIDKQTMEIHHAKHHQTYVDKLNKALENYKGNSQLDSLFKMASKLDPTLKNNAGGHYNHSLFWQLLKSNPTGVENNPEGKLAEAILKQFNSFDDFKKEFSEKSLKHFGSGWCWLIAKEEKIIITATVNQDNPLMDFSIEKGKPILALDLWEHAYYLKYQNKRNEYISNWWKIINWQKAEQNFLS